MTATLPKAAALLFLFTACVSYAPAPACDAGDSCTAWSCACASGSVEARTCSAGKCAEASVLCADACADAGSCWQGTAKGGWKDGNGSGTASCVPDAGPCGSTTFADVGRPCAMPGECGSGICLGSTASFICTKECSSVANCPAGWACGAIGNGMTACFLGAPEQEGFETSTNEACGQVGFSDVGLACTVNTDCQSKVCFGNSTKGFVCSRRCNTADICPAGWACVTSTPDSAKFCDKP